MRKRQQIAGIGINKLKGVVLIPIMIWILSQQQIYSQTVNIDLQKKQTVLDKEATIDKAKFIENEKRLRIENKKQLETIRKQDSIIQSLTKENVTALKRIEERNKQIGKLTQQIIKLGELQLRFEEKKKKPKSLFVKFSIDYLPSTKNYLPSTGVVFLGKKIGYGANLGLFDNNIYYGGSIFINLN